MNVSTNGAPPFSRRLLPSVTSPAPGHARLALPTLLSFALLIGAALLTLASGAGATPQAKQDWPKEVKSALNTITKEELFAHVCVLASDQYEGRGAGERGGKLAGDYVALGFKTFGLEPLGENGTYFQPVPITGKPEAEWGRNVVGIYRGADENLKGEAIIIGAHYDHIGFARHQPSLSRGHPGVLHNGADDNASGTAGILEVAEAFCNKKVKQKRSVIFIAFDGEELGLLGSKVYASHPTFPVDHIRAMLNIDMISRNKPTEMYFGKMEKFSGLNELVAGVARRFQIELNPNGMDEYMQRSDQWSFIEKGIPAVFIFGGMHPDYHTEFDDPEKVNQQKMQEIARLMFLFAYECAQYDGAFSTPDAGAAGGTPPSGEKPQPGSDPGPPPPQPVPPAPPHPRSH